LDLNFVEDEQKQEDLEVAVAIQFFFLKICSRNLMIVVSTNKAWSWKELMK
jgi:hypothetical protein